MKLAWVKTKPAKEIAKAVQERYIQALIKYGMVSLAAQPMDEYTDENHHYRRFWADSCNLMSY